MKCLNILFIFLFFLHLSEFFSKNLSNLSKIRSNFGTDSFLLELTQNAKTNMTDISLEFLENFIEKNNLTDFKEHSKKATNKINDSKHHLIKKLKETLEKYLQLKKKKDQKIKKTNDAYFFRRLFKYDYKTAVKLLTKNSQNSQTKITEKDIDKLKKNLEKIHINFNDDMNFRFKNKQNLKEKPLLKIIPIQKFTKSLIKVKPYNIILQNTSIITKNNNPIVIKNELYHKIIQMRKDKLKIDEKVIPIEKCNINWDYKKHGNDWNCLCQCGNRQSPINIKINSKIGDTSVNKTNTTTINKLNNDFKIFFDFRDSKACEQSKERYTLCKKPIMKNNGKTLEIEYDCGIIVMPPHNNGYRCYKIQIHSPSEHKINNEQFDLEIQIYYKMADRRIIDSSTTETISVVTFFKGLEKSDLKNIKDTIIRNHPFLSQLDTSCLPKIKGEAKLLNNYLDFSLLFDKSKQPYQYKKLNNRKSKKFSDLYTEIKLNKVQKKTLLSAINELTYNKNYPLNEYYTYHGSFTSPPCIEDVTFIIYPKPLLAPLDQIIDISRIISKCTSLGNYRNTQKINGRNIYYFQSENVLENAFEQLNLLGDFSLDENVDYILTGERKKKKNFNKQELYRSPNKPTYKLNEESTHTHPDDEVPEKCNDEELIDKIIDSKNRDVDLFLKNNNLK